MAYTKTEWKARKGTNLSRFNKAQETTRSIILHNEPSLVTEPGTPFNIENMNKIEQGIFDAHEMVTAETQERSIAIQNHNTNANAHTDIRNILNSLIGLPEWDPYKHILTFTAKDGSTLIVDIPLEDLTKDIDFDPATNEIILLKHDGTEIRIDVSALVDVYIGSIGTHIQITIGNNNQINAVLRAGSITQAELSTAFLSTIVRTSEKGAAGGVATLDANGKVPANQIPGDGGLHVVSRNNTLNGDGTSNSPLGVNTSVIAPIASPNFTGTPRVPNKTSIASANGTLIATEAQVYNAEGRIISRGNNISDNGWTDFGNPILNIQFGENLAGSPDTDWTSFLTLGSGAYVSQLAFPIHNNILFMRRKVNGVFSHWEKIAKGESHAVGEIYVRYPNNGYWPGHPPTPAQMYGGAWSDITYAFTGRFPRAAGGNAGGFGTFLDDAIREITGELGWGGHRLFTVANGVFEGVDATGNFRVTTEAGGTDPYCRGRFRASREVPTAPEFRPACFAVEVWICTAI